MRIVALGLIGGVTGSASVGMLPDDAGLAGEKTDGALEVLSVTLALSVTVDPSSLNSSVPSALGRCRKSTTLFFRLRPPYTLEYRPTPKASPDMLETELCSVGRTGALLSENAYDVLTLPRFD